MFDDEIDETGTTGDPNDPGVVVDFFHSATFSWDGSLVHFIDERFGVGCLTPLEFERHGQSIRSPVRPVGSAWSSPGLAPQHDRGLEPRHHHLVDRCALLPPRRRVLGRLTSHMAKVVQLQGSISTSEGSLRLTVLADIDAQQGEPEAPAWSARAP